MESNCKKIKFRHKNNNTFSKTFIAIGQTIKSTPNQISNKEVAFIVKKSKELNEQAKCNGMQEDVKSDGKHPKVISKELPSTEVSVSLLISRNHNASISASCYFNSKEQQQSLPFPIRKFNNNNNYERNSFPLKTPRRLKIVEIPFEEKQLIKINGKEEIKKREEEFSPYSVPTSPQTNFTWPNFKSSNKSDSTGIGSSLSVSSNNSSNGESDNHFFIQNKSRDYRVISLDEKPCPGRLDDFVPEVERGNEEINRKIVEEKKTAKGKNKLEQKFVNFPSLNRAHSTIYGEREINKKWSNESRRKFEKISNGCEIKKGTNSLERDSSGRLIIPSNEWRKFLAEQRPSNVNKINSQLQIVFRRDNYSNL